MSRSAVVTALCIVLGAAAATFGGVLIFNSSAYSVPTSAVESISQPQIQILSSKLLTPIVAFADFTDPADYVVRVGCGNVADATGTTQTFESEVKRYGPLTITIRVSTGYGPGFEWSRLTDAEALHAPTDDNAASRPIHTASGSGSYVVLRAHLDSTHEYTQFHLRPLANPVSRAGPYERLSLPAFTSGGTDGLTDGLDSMEPPSKALLGGTLDGVEYFQPRLSMWVDAFEEEGTDMVLQHVSPTPAYQPPLAWKVQNRFVADVLYRDTKWDKRAAGLVALGGILTGLGSGAVLVPLGALIGERVEETELESGKRKGRRR